MNRILASTVALAAVAGASPLAVASAPSTSAQVNAYDIVELSPFEVSDTATRAGRYTSLESTSAGRVRADIMDSSQSISVITEEMMEDVAPGRIVDVAQYVAGVSDSTLPTSWERITLRGFGGEGRTVDGITSAGYPNVGAQNIDPAIIERIEIVKGPNLILAPQATSPGGTINSETKKPRFRDSGLIQLRAGRFDANSGLLDVNRAVNHKLAVRFVGSERNWDQYWKGAHLHSSTLMPALTYRFSAHAQATVQYIYTDWKASNYFGIPLDPASSSTTPARILAGVPRDLHPYPVDAFRATRQHEYKLFVTARLPMGIQTRLVAGYNTNQQHVTQINIGERKGGDGGSVNPLTGLWTYGVTYAAKPPYAPSPIVVPPTRTFTRTGSELTANPRQFNFQNDYAYLLESDRSRSMTVAGVAYRDQRSVTRNYTLSVPEFEIDRYVDKPWTRSGRGGTPAPLNSRFRQGYLSENLALFRNRLILNAAKSWQIHGTTQTTNRHVVTAGAVIKPAGDTVSLYYGYGEQSSSATPPNDSQQQEFGARIKGWKNMLYFTVSRFDITQANYRISNPGRLRDPFAPGSLYLDVRSKGWEYEIHANPAKSLSVVGTFTDLKSRDPNNVEFRGVAERAGGVLASFTFGKENIAALTGVRVAVGASHLGRRPGDMPTGITDAGVPVQPSFHLGARTLVNLALAYNSQRHWSAQVNMDNALDEDYLLTGINRNAVFTGPARNLRASLRYAF